MFPFLLRLVPVSDINYCLNTGRREKGLYYQRLKKKKERQLFKYSIFRQNYNVHLVNNGKEKHERAFSCKGTMKRERERGKFYRNGFVNLAST